MIPRVCYLLNAAGEPEPTADLWAWALWFETADRTLAQTSIEDVTISTVFLGLAHGHVPDHPLLWETMVFGGELDGHCRRYETRDEALAGHATTITAVERAES